MDRKRETYSINQSNFSTLNKSLLKNLKNYAKIVDICIE